MLHAAPSAQDECAARFCTTYFVLETGYFDPEVSLPPRVGAQRVPPRVAEGV